MNTIKEGTPDSRQPVQRKTGRISLIMIALSALISAIFSGYDYYVQRNNLKQNFDEICAPIPGQIAGSLGKPIWFGDMAMIKELIGAQMRQKRLYAVAVKEEANTVFAVSRDKDWNFAASDGNITGDYIIRKEPILYETKPVGVAELYFTTQFEDESLGKLFFSLIIKVLLLSIILVFVLLAVVQALLIRPITMITGHLQQIGNEVGNSLSELKIITGQLIEGANRQASAIGQTSASIEQISAITRQNTDNADKANHQMIRTFEAAIRAGEYMTRLMASIEDIERTGALTRQIIHTVDDIGFQTRILALNAAVEAARAGQSGAGFAVVAQEVKNLAGRSSEAAGSSAELIETSIQRIRHSRDAAILVNNVFTGLSDDAKIVKDSLAGVTSASLEQFRGINEITIAMNEIDQVTQENVTNAETAGSVFRHIDNQIEAMRKEISELVGLTGSERKKE